MRNIFDWAQTILLNELTSRAVGAAVDTAVATVTAPVVMAGALAKAGTTYLVVAMLQVTISGTWYLTTCAASGAYCLFFKPLPKKSEDFDDCDQEIKVIEMATQTPGIT